MSSEWTIVKHNVKVVKQPVVVEQKSEVRPSREEKYKTENERRLKWEQRRQNKIDEYNAEFPLLPGSKDVAIDVQKIAYIDAKIALRKETKHKAYLQREARREEKARREAELAEIAEKLHVRNMIEKWGSHRWYRRVAFTQDDCDTAQNIRDEEEEQEWRLEHLERIEEEEEVKREEIRLVEKQKYIADQTANMTEQEKKQWITDYEHEEMIQTEDCLFSYWNSVNYNIMRQKIEDKERLDKWNEKQ